MSLTRRFLSGRVTQRKMDRQTDRKMQIHSISNFIRCFFPVGLYKKLLQNLSLYRIGFLSTSASLPENAQSAFMLTTMIHLTWLDVSNSLDLTFSTNPCNKASNPSRIKTELTMWCCLIPRKKKK